MANFDAAAVTYVNGLAYNGVISGSLGVPPPSRSKTAGRFVIFDKSHKRTRSFSLSG